MYNIWCKYQKRDTLWTSNEYQQEMPKIVVAIPAQAKAQITFEQSDTFCS